MVHGYVFSSKARIRLTCRTTHSSTTRTTPSLSSYLAPCSSVNDLSKPISSQSTSTRSTQTRSSSEHQPSQGIGHRQTPPTTGSLALLSSTGIQRGSHLTTPRTMCIRLMFIISTHPSIGISPRSSCRIRERPYQPANISYPVKSVFYPYLLSLSTLSIYRIA